MALLKKSGVEIVGTLAEMDLLAAIGSALR